MSKAIKSAVDVDALRLIYAQGGAAKAALDYFASRTNGNKVTEIATLAKAVRFPLSHLVRFMKHDLASACECGRYISGRRGRPSRFRWYVKLVELGLAARGERESVSWLPAYAPDEDQDATPTPDTSTGPPGAIDHRFQLRANFWTNLTLPGDLTTGEAEKLAAFVRLLPLSAG